MSIFCESVAFFVVKACERAFAQSKPSAAASKLPRSLHHKLKVVVTVDRAADAFVVVAELIEGDDTVGFLRVPLGHELLEDLFWGFFAFFYLGVFTCIVNLSDVFKCDATILCHIKLVVGSFNPDLASVVNFTLEGAKELVITDSAVAITIEMI